MSSVQWVASVESAKVAPSSERDPVFHLPKDHIRSKGKGEAVEIRSNFSDNADDSYPILPLRHTRATSTLPLLEHTKALP